MCRAKLAQRFECCAAAAKIEVNEDIIKNHRQSVDVICVFADQCEPHREIELLCSAAAQELRRKADAVRSLDLDYAAVEWSNDACVAAFGHDVEER